MNLRQERGAILRPRVLAHTFLIVIVTSLVGCTTTLRPTPTEFPPTQWEDGELIAAMSQRAEQFRSVRALARVDYSGPEGNNGFEEAVVAQRPDRLRLETLTMLGAALIVTVNDREIVGYHPREGVVVRGQRSKENLLRYTQIPLELNEITALLVGVPPVNTHAPWRRVGNSLVFAAADGKKDVVSFESHQAVPTKWERVDGGGETELGAKFSQYVATAAGLFPAKIEVESPRQNKRLAIHYQDPEVNAALAPELFLQQIPPNVKEYPIEALGK